jgi:hypothetical protein
MHRQLEKEKMKLFKSSNDKKHRWSCTYIFLYKCLILIKILNLKLTLKYLWMWCESNPSFAFLNCLIYVWVDWMDK